MAYGVVIPNHYPDIIQPLVRSLREYEPDVEPLIVADHHENGYGFKVITHTITPFQFAKAVNLGIRHLKDLDIVLLNDDCVLLEPIFDKLEEVANLFPKIGIVSPLILGCAGNPVQRYHESRKHWDKYETIRFVWGDMPVCFPCVYLKRKMLDEIGMLDETIKGYGYDDDEYCLRARKSGWITAITSELVIQHGDGGRELGEGRGKTWSVSFARRDHEGRSG